MNTVYNVILNKTCFIRLTTNLYGVWIIGFNMKLYKAKYKAIKVVEFSRTGVQITGNWSLSLTSANISEYKNAFQ